jgi:hypothetical protein
MDDLGWTVVGVALLVVACAVAGWGALELREAPEKPPETPVVVAPPPAPRLEPAPSDVERFYDTAYTVACPLDADAAGSSGGAYRLDPGGVDPALAAVAETLSRDASIDRGKLLFLAPPGATKATIQVDGYGELVATWTDPGPVGPKAPPTPCTSITTAARSARISGRVLDPRGSDVVADCAIRRAHVEDEPPAYAIDVPMGRACNIRLIAADGATLGQPQVVTATGPTRLNLP